MIFKTLTLNNFRVFKDEHSIELSPRKDGVFTKPIVLFGGLNGAGKTSILAAIRLVLMGRRALGAGVSSKDYSNYLTDQINNESKKGKDDAIASIKLEFTHTHRGNHNTFVVTRVWDISGKESLSLRLNSEDLDVLSGDQVQATLSEMVPPGISDLFFFDGEKIAELAEDDTGAYLKEAVQKLLGIDVVNRLRDDLDIYIKQVAKDKLDKSSLEQIKKLESEKSAFYKRADEARERAEQLRPKLIELRKSVDAIEVELQEKGGAWAKTKSEEKARADELLQGEQKLSGAILNELDGVFPLALAPTAIASLVSQLEAERDVKQTDAFNSKLQEYSLGIASVIASELKTDIANVSILIDKFASSNQKAAERADVLLDISDSDFYRINAAMDDANASKNKVSELLKELSNVKSELASLSVNIERAPDESELSKLYGKLRVLDLEIADKKQQQKAFLISAKENMTKALEAAKRLEKLFTQQKNEASVMKAVSRVSSTQGVLNEFSSRLTKLRVSQLEDLFTKSYRRLARKGDLKLAACIDALTFDVELIDQDGIKINRKSLSAGEKQIFAFAILEALGKLSGRILPVVVDTPLGRLDSKHRDKLITHYFPEAGEQVILLSTDTEVDEDFYSLLSGKICRAYQINFDQDTRCSQIQEGYFWEEKHKEMV